MNPAWLQYAPLALQVLLFAWFGGRIVERLGAVKEALQKLTNETVPRLHARIDEHDRALAEARGERRARAVTHHGYPGGGDVG